MYPAHQIYNYINFAILFQQKKQLLNIHSFAVLFKKGSKSQENIGSDIFISPFLVGFRDIRMQKPAITIVICLPSLFVVVLSFYKLLGKVCR